MAVGLKSAVRWSVRWRNVGPEARENIMYENRLPVIFRTRAEARAWIEKTHGYLHRPTNLYLRKAPFHWRMPVPIRVQMVEILK